MKTISEFMKNEHHSCDKAFAAAEMASSGGNWDLAENAFEQFRNAMARHFHMEEDKLFPMLLAAGGPDGPVQVMHMEHAQMNALIEEMADALSHRDVQRYGGQSETLLIVMQQHNLKEEQMLYPIADHFLTSQREALLSSFQSA